MDFLSSNKSLLAAIIFLAVVANAFGENVTTQGTVKFWTKSDGALTCAVTGNPTQVTWFRGTEMIASRNSESGITPGNEKYNMTSNLTLFIRNVVIADQDTYICTGSYGGNTHVTNRTVVQVYVDPDKVLIEECNVAGSDDENDQQCKFVVDNETDTVNLTCTVAYFYPEDGVDITWTVAGDRIEPTWMRRYNGSDSDGSDPLTTGMRVGIAAAPNSEPYVCTVTGKALRGGERRLQAFVQRPSEMTSPRNPTAEGMPQEGGGLEIWVIVVIVAGCVVAIAAAVLLVWCRKRRQNKKPTKAKYKKTAQKDEEVEVTSP